MTTALSRRTLLRGASHARPVRRPPWTGDNLTDRCSRCDDCVAACPEQILHRGDGGFPEIRFDQDGCTLCGECAQACQADVFDLARPAFPWFAAIGSDCLASNNIHCQSCQDACDTRAIRFRPALARVPQPDIDPDACTGCGACVAVCPNNAIHLEKRHA
ncbi:MAG: ferredoxin-type protein NapF [Marinobacter sp.]|uniref:ferredoxin-type protein NapF n=1 Tax=Marinobacter sp. TaxID=50741 RepID=UPI00299CFFF2|nr:ferredoxin-type protein NapF [Marinobacter sp.]MDX1633975.1 ferredoxin-type protein NapF [Marinobacter sp.]